MTQKIIRNVLLLAVFAVLGGCQMTVLHPAGDIAIRQRDLLVAATLLMLLIIVPVLVLVGVFAYRYRQSNRKADYQPEWDHSIQLELAIWAAPLLIIIALGALTWIGTHKLDPYRPIDNSVTEKPLPGDAVPLTIDVVSLDWKWLFLYPDYGIATVNQVAAPVDRPIHFRLTSQTVMNSFFVPAVAGQVYTMAGMSTDLHALVRHPGSYKGFSANISGDGFTDMRFRFLAMSQGDFKDWVHKVRAGGGALSRPAYMSLMKPTRDAPVRYYASYAPSLFGRIVHRCVAPSATCAEHGTGPARADNEDGGRSTASAE
ncbi:MAG TPA: ubiquinol oxidase subunit II [Gammaproteobacteria bacterium]|nr:ubiquinol oxidase subunit II [Gammaproteobacteria bacterium]